MLAQGDTRYPSDQPIVQPLPQPRVQVIVRSWESLARELLDAAGVGWDNPVTECATLAMNENELPRCGSLSLLAF
jgi:hypothetical protein